MISAFPPWSLAGIVLHPKGGKLESRSSRRNNLPCSLSFDLLEYIRFEILTNVGSLGPRRKCDSGRGARVRVDESLFATIPFVEEFLRRSSSDDTLFDIAISIKSIDRCYDTYGMRDSGEANSRDVTRRGIDSFERPNSFGSFRLELGSEQSSILLFKDTGVAPWYLREAIEQEEMSRNENSMNA